MHSSDIPISLYDTEHVRKLEQQAIREDQLSDNPNDNPGLSLMILAGEACFRTVVSRWPTIKQVLILCGGGNNAGDGYVLARLLVESGRNVSVIQIGDASRLPKDAKICFESMCDLSLIHI